MNNIDYKDNDSVKTEVGKLWDKAKDARQKIDWEWYLHEQFDRGNHWVRWDKGTKQIKNIGGSSIQVTVNKIHQTLRAVRNYVTRNDPKWSVVSIHKDMKAIETAHKQERFLDYIARSQRMSQIGGDVVYGALIKSIEGVKVYWNPNEKDGAYEGKICIEKQSAWDTYIDPDATSVDDARYMFSAVKRHIEDLKRNKSYDQAAVERVVAEKELAASPMKSRLLEQQRGNSTQDSDDDTVIVKEGWIRCYNDDGTPYMRIVTIAGDGNEVIRNEATEEETFPFVFMQTDTHSSGIYGDGWVKNLIPLNKVYNSLISMIMEYTNVMTKGRYIADKGAGVKRVTNSTGEILTKKRGYDFREIQPSSMPAHPFNLIEVIGTNMEDIGAVHDATMGRIPSGAKSGRALEALQAGDANSMSDLIQNYEDFLSRVGTRVLEIAANKYTEARIVQILEPDGERENAAFIGGNVENQPEKVGDIDVITIHDMNDVYVTVGSGIAHTQEMKVERMLDLFDRGLVQPEEVRKALKLGPISDLLEEQPQQQPDNGADLDQLQAELQSVQSPEQLAELEQRAETLGV